MKLNTVVITGGTGSLGQALARAYLSDPDGPRVRILSRDEHKQENMARALNSERLTFILGDVRDQEKLRQAFSGAQAVIHAAALKRVGTSEQAADEFVKTNVFGTYNVVAAAIRAGVPRSLLVSSDKAVAAHNTYGKTKAVAESIFIQGNRIGHTAGACFAVTRGGNVWGSRGSVVEIWKQRRMVGEPLTVNGPEATRFYLPMPAWVEFCQRALVEMHGGEVFIPKLRAWRLGDLASACGGDIVSGSRPEGDKLHEWLFTPEESRRVIDVDWAYVLEPPQAVRAVWNYQTWEGSRVLADFEYTSRTVPHMSIIELAQMMNER